MFLLYLPSYRTNWLSAAGDTTLFVVGGINMAAGNIARATYMHPTSIKTFKVETSDFFLNENQPEFGRSFTSDGIKFLTRLHSSRMHTTRLLTVSSSIHCAGGVLCQGGSALSGGSALPGEVSLPRGVVSQHAMGQNPPVNRILDTRLRKYYLAPNFVCGR